MLEQTVVGEFIDAAVLDHSQAKRLLDAYPELRKATWFGDDPVLTFLVIENFLSGVRFCLGHQFDPDQPHPHDGDTPLVYACYLNHSGVAELLLQHGADPNATSLCRDNPIHCTMQNGNAALLDLLLQHDADPNYETDIGETIFDNWPNDAAVQSELNAVLQEHGVLPNKEQRK